MADNVPLGSMQLGSRQQLGKSTFTAVVLAMDGAPAFGPFWDGRAAAGLPMVGRPLLGHVVAYLARQGARKVIVLLREDPYPLEAHFAATPHTMHPEFRLVPADQSVEAELARLAGNGEIAGPVVLARGDALTAINLRQAVMSHRRSGAAATALYVPGPEEPLRTGLDILSSAALAALSVNGIAADVPAHLRTRGLTVAERLVRGYWQLASHPAGYARALADVLAGRVSGVQPAGTPRAPGVWVAEGARVDPRAKLLAPAYVGPESQILEDATLGPFAAVEGPCRLARGATLAHGMAFPGTAIGLAADWQHALLFAGGWLDPKGDSHMPEDPAELGPVARPPLADFAHGLLDRAIAAAGLVALAPVFGLITLAIRMDSPGPAIFRQLRIGQDRRRVPLGPPRGSAFEVYKFRTMYVDAEARRAELAASNKYVGSAAFFKLDDDPRVTRVGAWLRRTSLDELPQLLNVLRGEMRLVGNRPLPLYEAKALTQRWQRQRFLAPAGITGLWQVSNRDAESTAERLALDAYYAAHRTFRGDLAILWRTFPVVLGRKGAR